MSFSARRACHNSSGRLRTEGCEIARLICPTTKRWSLRRGQPTGHLRMADVEGGQSVAGRRRVPTTDERDVK